MLGRTSRARAAEEALRALCSERLGTAFELEVVDVAEHPERAEQARIVATPTLDRVGPTPPVRVLGDLTLLHGLADVLGLPLDPVTSQKGT